MHKCGLESHTLWGNYLVVMLAEADYMHTAQEVFDKLANRNERSWNSLVVGYIECGETEEGLLLYSSGIQKSIAFDGHTYVTLLKACTKTKDIKRGSEIHSHVAELGLLKEDSYIGSSLVDMYAKCCCLTRAQQAFDECPVRDVVLWTTLIAGYTEQGLGEEAFQCFQQMEHDGIIPNAVTLIFAVKSSGSVGAMDKVQEIHADVERQSLLDMDLALVNTFIDAYARRGWFLIAEEVLQQAPDPNVISWTSLMAGFVDHKLGEEALSCLGKMRMEGIFPDAAAYVLCLKACGIIGSVSRGRAIHAEMEPQGFFESNLFVETTMVDMYASCGSVEEAQKVSDRLPSKNVAVWNALVAGYIECGHYEKALECFEKMKMEGIPPDEITFVCSLRACGCIGATDKAQSIHTEIERRELVTDIVGNTLIDVYSKCGSLAVAQEVFNELPTRDVVSWTALISGYAEHGDGPRALDCFQKMQSEGVPPDAATFVCSLKACGSLRATTEGREIHAEIKRRGLLDTDLMVGNTLIDMYAKCGLPLKAWQVFEGLPDRSVVSWNALITAYGDHGFWEQVLECFDQMRYEGVSPNEITYIWSLEACASLGAIDRVEEIYDEVEGQGLMDLDPVIGITLVKVYAKCGLLVKAQKVFDNLSAPDIVSWTALITGYLEHGHSEKAIECYERTQSILPNAVTFLCSLKACGTIGAIDKGQEMHADLERRGLLQGEFVGNTLIDMYGKCGELDKAREVFDRLPARDVVTWTSLMSGYAEFGEGYFVSLGLEMMLAEGMKPDSVTFVVVLTACTRTGKWDHSQTYFEAMSNEYGIAPTSAHYGCMVHIFGCAGNLEMAVAMSRKTGSQSNLAVWHAVLGACQKWENVDFGKQAFEQAICLNERDPSAYMLMSNIYAVAGSS